MSDENFIDDGLASIIQCVEKRTREIVKLEAEHE